MHHLSIDLETFSSVPIVKAGAQKYIASPDFEILLFAYSLDGAPVQVIDLAMGESLPPWLTWAITSPEFIKRAYKPPLSGDAYQRFWGRCRPANGAAPCFTGSTAAILRAWTLRDGPWGSQRTSGS